MIKSLNQLVTGECNSRCKMCFIWTLGEDKGKMAPEEFGSLYKKNEFRTVEDLCISGGEPTMREDLQEIMDNILPNLPQLQMLFLSTNCSFPERVIDFAEKNSNHVPEVYPVVSLEGDRKTHNKIRGVDSYDQTIDVINSLNKLPPNNIQPIISMTLQYENCNRHSLDHLRHLAEETGSGFTFRPATKNDSYYANKKSKNLEFTEEQNNLLLDYMKTHKKEDPFMNQLSKFLRGEETVMGSREEGIKCQAGNISAFIKSNGDIYPCINSSRIIGDKEQGIYKFNYKLGDKESCPCCTECQIYPMINYSKE